ncbi:MAG: helix-turn-helix domain-containing protein [Janthinobacterium lividum]
MRCFYLSSIMAVNIKKLVFNDKLQIGIDFIEVDHNYARSKKNLATPHRASFYSVMWLKAGDMVHQVDFNSIAVKANTFLFVSKDAIQFFDHERSFTSQILIFTDTFFSTNNSNHQFLKTSSLFNDLTNESATAVAATADLQVLWECMTTEFRRSADHYQSELLRNDLYSFLLTAERERNHQRFIRPALNNQLARLVLFRESLEQHFCEQKPTRFYAEQLAVTNKVLSNATLRSVGKTPKQMADERVILEAKRMLIYSNDPGKVIGFSLGFEEATNFIKFFKKQTGLTPTAFRKRYSF